VHADAFVMPCAAAKLTRASRYPCNNLARRVQPIRLTINFEWMASTLTMSVPRLQWVVLYVAGGQA
jgi:hypothetical protein